MEFLLTPIITIPTVDGDHMYQNTFSFPPDHYGVCGLKMLYCEATDTGLVEETIMRAASGIWTSCSAILTRDHVLMQVHCQPVSHDWHGYCVRCLVNRIASPDTLEIQSSAVIVSSTCPFHIVMVGEQLKNELGYACEELVGRSLKFLQGPSTNVESFKVMTEAVRFCVPHETILNVHRKDGSEICIGLRLRPTLVHSQAGDAFVATCVHAFPAASAPPSEPCLAALLSSLELGSKRSTSVDSGPRGYHDEDPYHSPATAGGWSEVAEFAVPRPPQGADADLSSALSQLVRAGLILHWEWSTADSEAAAAAQVLADVATLRSRAAAAADGCPTGLLCAWLLGAAEAAAMDVAAAAALAASESFRPAQECVEQGVDLDFLLCCGP